MERIDILGRRYDVPAAVDSAGRDAVQQFHDEILASLVQRATLNGLRPTEQPMPDGSTVLVWPDLPDAIHDAAADERAATQGAESDPITEEE